MKVSILLLSVLLSFTQVWADEGPYLDPDYPNKKPPHIYTQKQIEEIRLEAGDEPFEKVDHLETAMMQTPVKSQGRRGTCSIFSSTAILEYNLKKMGLTMGDPDLSEQWLEYITAAQRGSEGSWSYYNFDQYGEYGFIDERVWPYEAQTWYPYNEDYWEFQATSVEKAIFEQFCAPLEGSFSFDGCLIGQMDPAFLNLDDSTLLERNAQFYEWKSQAFDSLLKHRLDIGSEHMFDNAAIQDSLDRGEVMALDVSFFYEAWNHGRALGLGLQKDEDLWAQGVVSYPHPDSKDYVESRNSDVRAGHSVVLIGYDLDKVITREVENANGKMMTVTTKGVYYFKNSWGAESSTSFGAEFELKGVQFPGFGMISMDYAHEHGTFYKMNIQRN